jgi:hypothetical protein
MHSPGPIFYEEIPFRVPFPSYWHVCIFTIKGIFHDIFRRDSMLATLRTTTYATPEIHYRMEMGLGMCVR